MSSRRIALLVGGLVVALVVGLWLHRSDEEQVREAAEAIVDGANQGPVELSRALEEHAIDQVAVTVSDLPEPLLGRNALIAAASRRRCWPADHFAAIRQIRSKAQRSPNADLVATLAAGLRGLTRHARCRLFHKSTNASGGIGEVERPSTLSRAWTLRNAPL